MVTHTPTVLSSSCSVHAGASDCDAFNDAGSSPLFRSVPTQSAPTQPVPTHIGNSVNIVTGNNYQGELDFKTADSFLSFKRHYNSVNAGFNTGLGAGWRNTYDVSMTHQDESNLSIVQSDGRIINFIEKPRTHRDDSGNEPSADNNETRWFETGNASDGLIYRQGNDYSWQLPDSRTLHFKGRFLTHIDFGSGHTLKLFYKNQRLSTVTDESGRQLRYEYTEGSGLGTYQNDEYTSHPGHLERIVLPDNSSIQFFYDAQRNLRKVIQSDGSILEYRYQEGFYPGFLISSSRDNILQRDWAYHGDGRVASYSDHTNFVDMSFSYTLEQGQPETGYTLVTGKKGNKYRYQWQEIETDNTEATTAAGNNREHSQYRITAVSGDRCIGCPAFHPTNNPGHEESGKSENDNTVHVVFPSSIFTRLNDLEVEVLSTDENGYPEQVQLQTTNNGVNPIVNLNFSDKGKLESMMIPRSNKSFGDLTEPAVHEQILELGRSLGNAGDFDTRSYQPPADQDDYSGATTPPVDPADWRPGMPTPGNPPLCTETPDCDALDRAQYYYDFAYCAYEINRPCNNDIPEDWEYVNPFEAGVGEPEDISNLTHVQDFDGAVFYNESENRVIISFSGSDHPSDVVAGIFLSSGGNSYQGRAAINLAQAVRRLYPEATIETTGHSLGGGLAILAASLLDVEGVVYGSIGIDQDSSDHYGVDWETTDQIDHFFVNGDPVADPFTMHFSISNSVDGLVYESNNFLPARAVTYELSQPPDQSWGFLGSHEFANLDTTLEHYLEELGCE